MRLLLRNPTSHHPAHREPACEQVREQPFWQFEALRRGTMRTLQTTHGYKRRREHGVAHFVRVVAVVGWLCEVAADPRAFIQPLSPSPALSSSLLLPFTPTPTSSTIRNFASQSPRASPTALELSFGGGGSNSGVGWDGGGGRGDGGNLRYSTQYYLRLCHAFSSTEAARGARAPSDGRPGPALGRELPLARSPLQDLHHRSRASSYDPRASLSTVFRYGTSGTNTTICCYQALRAASGRSS